MALGDALALTGATLNSFTAVCLVSGRVAVARRKVKTHRALMVTAFAGSIFFLATYVTRVVVTGTLRDPHSGWFHAAYLAILFSHMILAVAIVLLVPWTLWLAFRGRFDAHRKVARVTFPIWLYVSVTGVFVYLALYWL